MMTQKRRNVYLRLLFICTIFLTSIAILRFINLIKCKYWATLTNSINRNLYNLLISFLKFEKSFTFFFYLVVHLNRFGGFTAETSAFVSLSKLREAQPIDNTKDNRQEKSTEIGIDHKPSTKLGTADEISTKLGNKEEILIKVSTPDTISTKLGTGQETSLEPATIIKIRQRIAHYNKQQTVLNDDRFKPLESGSLIIVVQVRKTSKTLKKKKQ